MLTGCASQPETTRAISWKYPVPQLRAIASRLTSSTVVWSWAFNFLRLAQGLLVLPLLMRLLPPADFGMYFVFLSLNNIVTVLDLGFSPTIGRFVAYAMAGAQKLTATGLDDAAPNGQPNFPLLWELLATARVFYGFVVLATLLLLGFGGTYMVGLHIHEVSMPAFTWLAWGVSVAAICAETYFNVWNMFLRNMNHVLAATRIYSMAYALRLCMACVFLIKGGGLLSLPLASLLTSLLIWNVSRAKCLSMLPGSSRPESVNWKEHFRTMWPNSWRLGLYIGGVYMVSTTNQNLCAYLFGLQVAGIYGFSVQVIGIVAGMAGVWTLVKWPLLGQYIASRNLSALSRVLRNRLFLQVASFVALACAALLVGPFLIRLIGSDKHMLPLLWMVLLALNGLLDAHCSVWNTLISMYNQLPMLWPSLVTNAAALLLNIALLLLPDAHPGYMVLGPLLAGLAYNYWHWPAYAARMLGTSWLRFMGGSLPGVPSPATTKRIG